MPLGLTLGHILLVQRLYQRHTLKAFRASVVLNPAGPLQEGGVFNPVILSALGFLRALCVLCGEWGWRTATGNLKT